MKVLCPLRPFIGWLCSFGLFSGFRASSPRVSTKAALAAWLCAIARRLDWYGGVST